MSQEHANPVPSYLKVFYALLTLTILTVVAAKALHFCAETLLGFGLKDAFEIPVDRSLETHAFQFSLDNHANGDTLHPACR